MNSVRTRMPGSVLKARIRDLARNRVPISQIAQRTGFTRSVIEAVLDEPPPEAAPANPTAPSQLIKPISSSLDVHRPDPYEEAEFRLISVYKFNGKTPRLITRNGIRFLDGAPVMSLTQLMKAVNQERKRAGERQLDANPEWRV